MKEDEVKGLESRISDLEKMMSLVASQVSQLKTCEHEWSPISGQSTVLSRVGIQSYECSKCKIRCNDFDATESFN